MNDSSNIVALSEELPIPQGIRVYPSISGAGSDSSILDLQHDRQGKKCK